MYTSKLLYYTLLQEDDAFNRLLDHLESMPTEHFETELEDHAFASIRSHLVHLLLSGSRIMYMLGDREEPQHDIAELRGILEFRSAWNAWKRRASGWLMGKSEKELDHFENFTWPSGRETRMPHGTMFMRMLFHIAHHKGQIAAQCRLLGFPPPNTEILWIMPDSGSSSTPADTSQPAPQSEEE
ncbi:DinB family protein [bacterium]|nr:DinB family protein [bacterium]